MNNIYLSRHAEMRAMQRGLTHETIENIFSSEETKISFAGEGSIKYKCKDCVAIVAGSTIKTVYHEPHRWNIYADKRIDSYDKILLAIGYAPCEVLPKGLIRRLRSKETSEDRSYEILYCNICMVCNKPAEARDYIEFVTRRNPFKCRRSMNASVPVSVSPSEGRRIDPEEGTPIFSLPSMRVGVDYPRMETGREENSWASNSHIQSPKGGVQIRHSQSS